METFTSEWRFRLVSGILIPTKQGGITENITVSPTQPKTKLAKIQVFGLRFKQDKYENMEKRNRAAMHRDTVLVI